MGYDIGKRPYRRVRRRGRYRHDMAQKEGQNVLRRVLLLPLPLQKKKTEARAGKSNMPRSDKNLYRIVQPKAFKKAFGRIYGGGKPSAMHDGRRLQRRPSSYF